MPGKVTPAIHLFFLYFLLVVALAAHGLTENDFCAQTKTPPDVCTNKKVETITCLREPGDKLPVCKGDTALNDTKQLDKPYVVLVSLDGFRWDYSSKCAAKHLQELARQGASAPEGMIPSYPSLTFPNHYTIVTGLYPEHHGIVANSFYEPSCRSNRMARYSYTDPESSLDGRWYGGIPLWSLAEEQGMRSACLFWPGSEARIATHRPAYFLRFKDDTPEETRIDQIIAWLRKPAAERPHFITLYYSNVDSKGHEFGPDSVETCDAVHRVDRLIDKLWLELRAVSSDLNLRIDFIVLSDHGMTATERGWVNLDRYADLADFVTEGALLYPKTKEAAEKASSELGAGFTFTAHRRNSQRARDLHYDENARTGDPIVVPAGPYELRAHASEGQPIKGQHGYDPWQMIDMRAIFYAVGPDIRPGVQLPPFENVNVYPLIVKILGLEPCQVDGKLEVLENILVQQSK